MHLVMLIKSGKYFLTNEVKSNQKVVRIQYLICAVQKVMLLTRIFVMQFVFSNPDLKKVIYPSLNLHYNRKENSAAVSVS